MISKILEHCIDDDMGIQYKHHISTSTIATGTKTQLRKLRKQQKEYTEIHHIYPTSMGGNDNTENLVLMTGRNHFIAHWLLYKMTLDRRMIFAFNQMKRYIKQKGCDVELEQLYEDAKCDITKHMSIMAKETHQTKSDQEKEDFKKNCSERLKGTIVIRDITTGKNKRIRLVDFDQTIHQRVQTGTRRSEETKSILSNKAQPEYKGIPYHNPETKDIKFFHEGTQPNGWIRGNGITNIHTKGTVFFHNPETKEQIRCVDGQGPTGWIRGRAKFNNPFSGTNVKKHILTGKLSYDQIPQPLYVSPTAKGLYSYKNLLGNDCITGSMATLIEDLNLDYGYITAAMKDHNKLITSRTTSNGLNKTHKGKHICDVYAITFYPKEELSHDKCNSLLSEKTWR